MSDIEKKFFSGAIGTDFFRLFCGDVIGKGCSRTVYQLLIDRDLVVKIETSSYSFQNVIEWETWHTVKHTEHAKWFAECYYISPCGIVMLQKKTQEKPKSKYPKLIPSFFTDTKYGNFGFAGNQLKCHDYGIHLLIEKGLNKRMRKVEWWE